MGFFELCVRQTTRISDWLRLLKRQSNVNRYLSSFPGEKVCIHTQIFKMANVNKCIQEAADSLNIRRENRKIILKEEQERAVKELISGNDVLAILPTGFGKSMVYTIFTLASQKMRSAKTCVLVISPLKSLIDDQIVEMESLGCTALELKSDNVESVVKDPPQFIFSSAERVLEKPFLNGLKSQTILHEAVSAIVVDECHTVESWTGKR